MYFVHLANSAKLRLYFQHIQKCATHIVYANHYCLLRLCVACAYHDIYEQSVNVNQLSEYA